MCLPLSARGKTIGVATFAMSHSGRHFQEADLAFAAEFASRASILADNARLFEELRVTTEDLRHANSAKDEFLGLVSHELKTPITTIMGNADVLRRLFERLDAETRNQALEDIHNDAGRLDRLIENMLILARLERGEEIELEPVSLPRIVERVVDAHRRALPTRPIEVLFRDPRAVVAASAGYVEQVVNNLISNAAKYSPEDAPIEIAVERVGNEVAVDVLDRGNGIAPEEAEQVFEPFYRSPRTAGGAPGIGVGLAVCKRVIEAQHGHLWARPRPGGGSDFGFALPAADESTA
jgi:signal transduction histidine kinase